MQNLDKNKMIITALFIIFSLVAFAVVFGVFTAQDRVVLSPKAIIYNHDGVERKYLLYLPKNITPETDIVLGLHGYGGNARKFAYYTALHNVASDSIIIYPYGIDPGAGHKRGWNAQFCCGSGWKTDTDDVGFLNALVDTIATEHNISDKRAFVTGFSNGGFMAQRLAVDTPENYRAVAIMGSSIGTKENRLEPKSPMPITIFHGGKDATVPVEGGPSSTDAEFNWLSHQETVDAWEAVNEGHVQTRATVFPQNSHQWHDWRLYDFWNKKPVGSDFVVGFFERNK